MNKELLLDMPALYRDNFRIWGYRFGEGKKSVCIVGPTRGNEFQQQFIMASLVRRLRKIEEEGELIPGFEVLLIPSANPYSANTKKRFWPINNTDLNRMFSGSKRGEVTQNIARELLEEIHEFECGIQLCSHYTPGAFLPHVRIMKTDFDYLDLAKEFKMPYVVIKNPVAFDRSTLNYNWQRGGTAAFSLFSSSTRVIDKASAHTVVRSILLFLKSRGIITTDIPGGYDSEILDDDKDIISISTSEAGFFTPRVKPGFEVSRGDLLAEIHDPYTFETICEINSPADGVIFFMHSDPLTYSHSSVFKLIVKE